MKCIMCSREIDSDTKYQLCQDCKLKHFSSNTSNQETHVRKESQVLPRTATGGLSAILVSLATALFASIIITAKTHLFLTIAVAILTTLPAAISTILALIAYMGLHDKTIIVKASLIASIVLAVISLPIAMILSGLLPEGSLLPGARW